jgi:hypothetical protein
VGVSVAQQVGATIVTRALLLACGFAVLLALGGCGSSLPKRDPAKVARLVAEANALCAAVGRGSISSRTKEQEAAARRIQPTLNALYDAAAYLPVGRALNEAHARRRVLEHELPKDASNSVAFINRFHRLQRQIYYDLRALGVTRCASQPPPRPPIVG